MKLRILRDHESKQASAVAVKQPNRDRRSDPDVQARVAASRQREEQQQEQLALHRGKRRRSWEEIREAVARINGRTGE